MVAAGQVDDELEAEISDECGRFGVVKQVLIYQEKQGATGGVEVKIFVAFVDPCAAAAAQKSMDQRWFGGRMVHASLYDELQFFVQNYSQ
eukprot:CAMPEP_0198201888 /NCGR_PEP_ID=MMETSP1445-20131203/4918_1 /TAXON_ID=36898 /ORGANISM="Pyramimonas sp., Strain CCMP2087" /LENGTH=89 /DNA_ID=CAMNT_0043872539 /DNA_START=76 /DNA_END=345 /DNA_ORIENTATION=-